MRDRLPAHPGAPGGERAGGRDAVLVPCIPQEADLRGLRLFLATLGKVRRGINPHLEIMGIVPTMVDLRTVHHRSGLQALRDAGLPLLDVTIGRSVRVARR